MPQSLKRVLVSEIVTPRPYGLKRSTECGAGFEMTRSKADFDAVMSLVMAGHNDCEVSRRTGIPRPTVRDWRVGRGKDARRFPTGSDLRCSGEHDHSMLPSRFYSYLLGVYLGDGYIATHPHGVFRLRIVMDSQYPALVDETCAEMEAVMPTQRAYRRKLLCLPRWL